MKYNIYIKNDTFRPTAFLCRGKAIDSYNDCYVEEEVLECSEKRMRAIKENKQENVIFKAYYAPEEIFENDHTTDIPPLFEYHHARYLSAGTETAWYTSKERAIESAKKMFLQSDHIFLTSLPLDTEMYEPAQFPMEVRLTYEKQRGTGKESLCARINTHPELDGKWARGKIFFPDKSWKNPVEGPALVTSVKEKDNYGFMIGEVCKIPNVLASETKKDFIAYLLKAVNSDSYITESTKIDIVNSPVRGEYVVAHCKW